MVNISNASLYYWMNFDQSSPPPIIAPCQYVNWTSPNADEPTYGLPLPITTNVSCTQICDDSILLFGSQSKQSRELWLMVDHCIYVCIITTGPLTEVQYAITRALQRIYFKLSNRLASMRAIPRTSSRPQPLQISLTLVLCTFTRIFKHSLSRMTEK